MRRWFGIPFGTGQAHRRDSVSLVLLFVVLYAILGCAILASLFELKTAPDSDASADLPQHPIGSGGDDAAL